MLQDMCQSLQKQSIFGVSDTDAAKFSESQSNIAYYIRVANA